MRPVMYLPCPKYSAVLMHLNTERCRENLIIELGMAGLVGEHGKKINGPSLVRVPEWVESQLGIRGHGPSARGYQLPV